MEYVGKVFRPPSEASSLILQCTIGCSHNECSFCSMYKDDEFRIRPLEDILKDIQSMAIYKNVYKRVFLGDGDALILPMDSLRAIIKKIRNTFSYVERIGIYASPKSIATKSPAQLKELRDLGLGIAYLGLESGSDEVLTRVKKGSSAQKILELAKKIKDAGILLSITMISGLGGRELSQEHARESARLISQMEPDYLGLLTLMEEPGTQLYEEIREGSFVPLSPREILEETRLLVSLIRGQDIVFRSNHASNYLGLKGVLDRDKDQILESLDQALSNSKALRSQAHRAL